MIKSTNGALGIEVVREYDTIRFIGHFKEGLTSEIKVKVSDAKNMFDSTGTIEVLGHDNKSVGLIGYEPQGTNFFFPPNQNHDLICVDSVEINDAVRAAIGA